MSLALLIGTWVFLLAMWWGERIRGDAWMRAARASEAAARSHIKYLEGRLADTRKLLERHGYR